jgi:hypothetical protein
VLQETGAEAPFGWPVAAGQLQIFHETVSRAR